MNKNVHLDPRTSLKIGEATPELGRNHQFFIGSWRVQAGVVLLPLATLRALGPFRLNAVLLFIGAVLSLKKGETIPEFGRSHPFFMGSSPILYG